MPVLIIVIGSFEKTVGNTSNLLQKIINTTIMFTQCYNLSNL